VFVEKILARGPHERSIRMSKLSVYKCPRSY
jgi:hypothetical protein